MNTNSGWRKNQIKDKINQMNEFSYPKDIYPSDTNLTVDQIHAIFDAYHNVLDAWDLACEKYKGIDHPLKNEIHQTIMKLDKEFPWINPEPTNYN